MILVVDNHGFTTNILLHQLGTVHRITAAELAGLTLQKYSHIIITHGPEQPSLAHLKHHPNIPVLAIGSAAQHLAVSYGHTAQHRHEPAYGTLVTHQHNGTGLFNNVPAQTQLISYHPWRLESLSPNQFATHAIDQHNAVMAYQILGTLHYGIHCDPAALQSAHGTNILQNFLGLAPSAPPKTLQPPQAATEPKTLQLHTRIVPGKLDTAATFRKLQSGAEAAFWLDSSAAHLGQGNTSILGTNTGPLSQVVRWDAETNRLDLHTQTTRTTLVSNIFEYLTEHRWQPTEPTTLEGFTGGWIGYLGYEAKYATIDHAEHRWQATTPDAYWVKPQSFLTYHHEENITTIFAYQDEHLLDDIERTLVFETAQQPAHPTRPAKAARTFKAARQGSWRLTPTQYRHNVATIQQQLHQGAAAGICLTDMYQQKDFNGQGLDLYLQLRHNNPAPYAGYLRFNTFDDALEILCASPEKFLSIDAAGTIESKPIKGTVERHPNPEVDQRVAQQMAQDPKFQSENLMITDVLRDDLASISIPGSVKVTKLMAVETFATLHQLVTTVTAQLAPETTTTQVLSAVFPGGSMTGAPKRASLAVLDELEAGPRGIYSGTLGWIGDDNTTELNVIIRSIVLNNSTLQLGAGGAVVVDSDPEAEEQEKHLKIRALLQSITEVT